jgi:hypothetical protein
MSNALALATSGSPVQPGQIRFAQAALPPLPAGRYRLTAKQTVEGIKELDTPPEYDAKQPFQVQGPRFTLAPGDLQMVTPPGNATGDWENSLPNVVLRRRTIPWERTLDGSVPPSGVVPPPWLAVIGVTADELGGDAGSITAASPVRTGTVAQLVTPQDPTVLGPALGNSVSQADLTTQLLLLDMNAALFQSVSPTLADLPWLAHVREVNTDHKEILGLDEDGVFSVVIGNRTIQAGKVNYIFLVSLEGHQDHLSGSVLPPSVKTIRLASLAWWKVQADAAKGDFIEIMQALPHNGGVNLVQLPAAPGPTTTAEEKAAAMALGMGYVPLTYRMRAGEQATAWYRGPASAVPTKPDGLGPYVFSDQAIRYDPGTALFDVSQAAAWQIGRLLALSDSTFARELYEWRKSSHAAAAAAAGLTATTRMLPAAAQSVQAAPGAGSLAQAHLAAANALAVAFAALQSPAITERPEPPAIPQRMRREDRPVVAEAHPTIVAAAHGLRVLAAATPVDTDPMDALLAHVFSTPGEAQ